MTTIFATQDSDGDRITQNAFVRKFTTMEEARAWLLAPYERGGGWDMASAEIGPGRYSDCWVKAHSAPHPDVEWLAPFGFDELTIEGPGQHPGGRMWWITPAVEVLVISDIREIGETA